MKFPLVILTLLCSGALLSQTCSDGIRNQNETGIDCGGVCGGEPANADMCNATDLTSGVTLTGQTTECGSRRLFDCSGEEYIGVYYRISMEQTSYSYRISVDSASFVDSSYSVMVFYGTCNEPLKRVVKENLSVQDTFSLHNLLDNGHGLTLSGPLGLTIEDSTYYYYIFIGNKENSTGDFNIWMKEGSIADANIIGNTGDCFQAIPMCCNYRYDWETSFLSYNYVEELENTCIGRTETNSIWYTFTTADSGNLGLELYTEFNHNWALFDITEGGCEGIVTGESPLIRCNSSNSMGMTGMDTSTSNSAYPENEAVDKMSSGFITAKGRIYALAVTDPDSIKDRFSLAITGVSVKDNSYDLGAKAHYNYSSGRVEITLNELIPCPPWDAVTWDTSKFTLLNLDSNKAYPFDTAIGYACDPIGYVMNTRDIDIYAPSLPPGSYEVALDSAYRSEYYCKTAARGVIRAYFTVPDCDTLKAYLDIDSIINCAGTSTGWVSIDSITYGTPPYSIDWQGVNPDSIPAGTYSIEIYDSVGCYLKENYTIKEKDVLSLSLGKQDAPCNGALPGSASTNISGGVSPYTVNWFGYDPDNLEYPNTYLVEITDSEGCTLSETVTINSDSSILADVITTNIDCYGENTGSASLNISGDYPPYSIDWLGEDPDSLKAGQYQVEITDSIGCTISESYQINHLYPELVVSDSTVGVTCPGNSDGSATLNISGGLPPYNIDWFGDNPDSLSVGNYTVMVTDSLACSTQKTVTIATRYPTLSVSFSTTDASCFGASDGGVQWNLSGGVPPYSVLYDFDSTQLAAGRYEILATDSVGCNQQRYFFIEQPDSFYITARIGQTATGFPAIFVSDYNSTGRLRYSLDSLSWQGVSYMPYDSSGEYVAYARDENGCIATDTILIQLDFVSENLGNRQLVIIPNPATNVVKIKLPEALAVKQVQLEFSNSLGQKISSIPVKVNAHLFEADVSPFPTGLYYITLQSENRLVGWGKIVIEKE